MSIYLAIVIGYFLLISIVSILTRRIASKSAADFLIAGRNLGVITGAVVVASEWLGGMSTIGVSEKAFTTATLKPVLYNISTALGMVIIGFTVAKHYRREKVHTVSEMLVRLFGREVRLVSALAFLFAYIVLAFVQMQTAGSVISALFGTPWIYSVLISAALITLYTYFGGMHAIAIAGIIHLIVMFTGLGIALVSGLHEVGGLQNLREILVAQGAPSNLYNPFSGGMGYAWSLILGGVLGGMAGQASIQPIFAAKSELTAKKSAILSAFIIAPFGILVALLGLIAKTGMFFDVSTPASPLWDSSLASINPKMVLPVLLTTPEFIHPILGGLAISGVLAAILSTVGPVNFAVVTIAAKDLYHGLINPKADDKQIVSTARKMVLLVNIFTIPLAILATGAVLNTAYISYGIRAIGAIVILLGLYGVGWISKMGVILAFTGGTLAVLLNIALRLLGVETIQDTYVAIGSTLIFILLGNFLNSRSSHQSKPNL